MNQWINTSDTDTKESNLYFSSILCHCTSRVRLNRINPTELLQYCCFSASSYIHSRVIGYLGYMCVQKYARCNEKTDWHEDSDVWVNFQSHSVAIFKVECERHRRNFRNDLVFHFTGEETASQWINDLTKVTKRSVAGWGRIQATWLQTCVFYTPDLLGLHCPTQ